MADYNSSYTGAEIDEAVGNGLAAPTTYAPIDHASTGTTYGVGNGSKYGHLKLSDATNSTSSTSGGIAATPAAVKSAYDLANGKQDPATTLAGYGITDAASSAELGTFVRPNLLDNAYFVGGGQFPINQRGATSYTSGGQYTIDRWRCIVPNVSLSDSNGLSIYNGSGDIYAPTIRQPIECPAELAGKTVTASALLYSTTGSATIRLYKATGLNSGLVQIGSANNNGTSAQIISFTVDVPNDVGSSSYPMLLFELAVAKENTAIFQAAKLELGDTQTLAHQENGTWVLNEVPNFGEELARCERYYYAMPGYVRFPTTRWMTYEIDFLIPIPVTMRTTPTIVGTPVVYNGNTAQTGFTFAVTAPGNNALSIRASKASHGLTDDGVSLLAAGTALSADL